MTEKSHPAIQPDHVAVITGAASGIGLAAAKRLATAGMRVVMADVNDAALHNAKDQIVGLASAGTSSVLALQCDVARFDDLARVRDAAFSRNRLGVDEQRRHGRSAR